MYYCDGFGKDRENANDMKHEGRSANKLIQQIFKQIGNR